AVWVSEIMLQQTQVATVVDYYNRWIEKWPTLQALARASLQEVNELWAGLGYYSRGKRLQEAASKVLGMGGHFRSPLQPVGWHPGLGCGSSWEAGAAGSDGERSPVASAYLGASPSCRQEVCKGPGALSPQSPVPLTAISPRDMANALVDRSRPGDFNQALMELGATVCVPKAPLCGECPVKQHCQARRRVEKELASASQKLFGKPAPVPDVEDCGVGGCPLCPPAAEPWDSSLGVSPDVWLSVPRCAFCQLAFLSRSSPGLLAGLWEFPSVPLAQGLQEEEQKEALADHLQAWTGRPVAAGGLCPFQCLPAPSQVVHIFSHIHQTYVVYSLPLDGDVALDPALSPSHWVTE
ncbi:A/G-specific adenine DNA glycosylase, partial [Opisthocomus hoazin]